MQRPFGVVGVLCLAAAAGLGAPSVAHAVSIDQAGDISLGVRTYSGVRIGSEDTDEHTGVIVSEVDGQTYQTQRNSRTFPYSAAGHLRQHRTFIQAEWDHKCERLLQDGLGPLRLALDLPFRLEHLRYHLEYRGEFEGIYDYGPREYRTADGFRAVGASPESTGEARRRLRRLGVQRQRLFQAFVETQVGELFVRFGRQILAWGETDSFRLLDNINPLDSSFGGFLVSLDERRVPLDMLRASYQLGHLGPLSDAYVEAYATVDNRWGGFPGIPTGSPWQLPNSGAASPLTKSVTTQPAQTIDNARGGGLLKFNAPLPVIGDATFSLVHYYTYADLPAGRVVTNAPPGEPFIAHPFPDGSFVHANQTAQRFQISGASSTFVIPARFSRRIGLSGEPVIRTEFAYFNNEPRYRQSELDPFYFNLVDGRTASHRRTGDSVNFVLGLDMNQFVRWINPSNSIFLSTQFFFKHLNGATKRGPIPGYHDFFDPAIAIDDGEVLGTLEFSNAIGQPLFVHTPVNQYLQTLAIGTSYYSGRVVTSASVFYDWAGGFVFVPNVTFLRDPFRLMVQYNFMYANRLKGASGVSLFRDRDNVLFQIEYVL